MTVLDDDASAAVADIEFAPDEAQRAVIELPVEADGVVIGAPGTGKTRVLLARVERLLAGGERSADELLVLTSSRRTATLIRDELGLRVGRATPGALARSLGSLAFQIVRAAAVRAGDPAPQLLTGADQDRILADLLAGDAEDAERVDDRWPEELPAPARASRAFRSELRVVIGQCAELGVEAGELRALAVQFERPVWASAADFIDEYRDVLSDLRSAHRDSADLLAEAAAVVRRAGGTSDRVALLGPLGRLRMILIDDAQELTRGALDLIAALRESGVAVLAFGDPDIGSGAFRGVTAELFTRLAALLGTVHVLHTDHRASPAIARLGRMVTQAIGAGGRVDHRRPPGPELEDDRIRALLASSPVEEVDAIADVLRRWHLVEGIAWDDMAVIAHDTRQVSALDVELAAREVPTRATGVQRPLGRERIVRELLEIVSLAAVEPHERDPEALAAALRSPFGGLDAVGLRRLRAALRHRELADGGTATAGELLREAMADPLDLGLLDLREGRLAERLATTMRYLTEAYARGETIHELLWLVWDRARVDGKRLADLWREASAGGGAAATEADRQLDALVALFEAAKRAVERGTDAEPLAFVRTILDSDVPEDTLAAPDRGATVAILTPATALGTQYRAVVIAGVQEGVWPNVRLRGGLLDSWLLADAVEASRTGLAVEQPSALDRRRSALHDELRLFVRALSRAREHLVVTAVDDDDMGPSALFSFLPEPERTDSAAESGHPYTLRGLVAKHRRTLTSEPVEAATAEAAGQLRLLAEAGVPGAAVAEWYGMRPPSSTSGLRDPRTRPIPVSPSTIERYEACGIDWAVRALGGDTRSFSGGLGTILHAAMEQAPDGTISELQGIVDDRWGELDFEAEWLSDKERAWAHTLVARLHAYLAAFAGSGAQRVGAEAEFRLAVPLRDDVTGADAVHVAEDADLDLDAPVAMLRGSIDRVEAYGPSGGEDLPTGGERRVMVADLKTGKGPKKYMDRHVDDDAQLAAYQLAVLAGAVPGVVPGDLIGARLILLSKLRRGEDYRFARQNRLDEDAATTFARRVVTDARGMAAAHFAGQMDAHCLIDRFAVCTIHTVKAVSAS